MKYNLLIIISKVKNKIFQARRADIIIEIIDIIHFNTERVTLYHLSGLNSGLIY